MTARSPPRRKVQQPPPATTDDESSDTVEASALTAAADELIPYLREADYSVVVGLEHPNKITEDANGPTVSAYAKIAGKSWTYYVREPAISIGRSPDVPTRAMAEPGAQSSPRSPKEEVGLTHIDLGPSKLVSRVHARVFYNEVDEKWHILVTGRNGVRVNNQLLKRDNEVALNSGDVIEIASTEMIFVAPDVLAQVQPQYRARFEEQIKEEDVESGLWTSGVHSHPELPAQDHRPTSASGHPSMERPSLTNGHHPSARPHGNYAQAPSSMSTTQHLANSPYGQEVSLESSERIDYKSDAMKDKKPQCSYATLISQAILSKSEQKMSLDEIYTWIRTNFSYYRHLESNWQNSIRHNLSLNPAFKKMPRTSNEPGKGCMWYISEEKLEQIKADGFKMTSRGGARRSSAPNSPAPAKKSPLKTTPKREMNGTQLVFKTSSVERTSPVTGQGPFPPEAQTPTRGPRVPAGHGIIPQLSDDASPLPVRPYLSTNAAAGGSPATLTTSFYNDNEQTGYTSIYTPAPQRMEPKMTMPSTAKLPSQYLNLPNSSPDPYWRFRTEPSSTPRFPESSPLKAMNPSTAVTLQSSSPPPAATNGSPTKIRLAPLETGTNVKTNGQNMGFNPERFKVVKAVPVMPKTLDGHSGLGINTVSAASGDKDDDDDDGQLDLMR
jgi:pSer/pThr/pTyr-binding forkhead associated (FHA) protein